jgi:tetratricopeptide (TPR) repeat protein
MSLDPYQPCPCGSGSKIKFCCSKDIQAELDKIIRAVQGEQRASALDHIHHLIAEKGPRNALLAVKADVQLSLGKFEDADATIDEFLAASPDNPVALSLSAIHACSQDDLESAIEDLQQAMEHLDGMLAPSVYSAIGVVAQTLLQAGDVLAARGHLLMQAGLAGDQDENPVRLLMRINMLREVPLLLKQDYMYADCPEGVEWADDFDAAKKLALRGAWIAACEALDALEVKYPGQAAILRNIAILSGWVGQRDEAVVAWKKYARLKDVPLDEAVEAEALAQMLDPAAEVDEIDSVTVIYTVPDTEKLMELCLSDKRISKMPVDLSQLSAEGEPPPKAAFWLLDKPVPESGLELAREAIPNVLGEMYIFGKRTDRDARIEFSILRDEMFDAAKAALTEVLGEFVIDSPLEEVAGQVPKVTAALTWRWRLPDDTPPARRRELVAQQRSEVMLTRWPEVALKALGGKTPRQAAADPKLKVPTLAAILLLELGSEQNANEFDFNELRKALNLPTRDMIDPAGIDALKISIVKVPLLDVAKVSDEDLLMLYRRVVLKHASEAIRHLAKEVLHRSSLNDKVDKNETYDLLIRTAAGANDALSYVADAKKTAADAGQSPARWLLAELSIRLSTADTAECQKLVQTLQTRYMQEPGVAQGLYEILVSYGVISPGSMPAGSRRGAAPQMPAAPAAPAAASKLWTPDAPAAAGGGEKSKLWIPGMD